MDRVEELAIRPGALHDELTEMAGQPSARLYELLTERDALRAEAAGLTDSIDSERSTPELEAELAALIHLRKSLIDARTGYATGKGGNNAGPASGAWVTLNARSHAASGVDRLTARISKIEDVLAARRRATK